MRRGPSASKKDSNFTEGIVGLARGHRGKTNKAPGHWASQCITLHLPNKPIAQKLCLARRAANQSVHRHTTYEPPGLCASGVHMSVLTGARYEIDVPTAKTPLQPLLDIRLAASVSGSTAAAQRQQ